MNNLSENLVKAGAYIVNEWQTKHRSLKDEEEILLILTDSTYCQVDKELEIYGYGKLSFYNETRALTPELKTSLVSKARDLSARIYNNS